MNSNLIVTQCRTDHTADKEADSRCLWQRQRIEQLCEPAGKRILVAEDDRFLRTLMGTVLYRAGYAIVQAVDGEDAVQKFRNSPEGVDLLLLDIDMPKKNGRIVYDEIRQARPDIKVVFATAYPAEMMQRRGIISSDNHFLTKPFGPRLLLKKIREVLDA